MRTITKYLSMLMVVLSILVFASQTKAQITLLTEGWESAAIGSTPPAGWAVDQLGYGNWTYWVATSSFPSGVSPYEGSRMTRFDSWDAPSGYENRIRRTVPISTVGYANITVDFALLQQTVFSGDGIYVEWSTNGTVWTTAGGLFNTYGSPQMWVIKTQALPVGAAGQATLYVALRQHSNYGYDVYTDLLHVKGSQTGNLTGTVRNCFNNAVMANVPVSCGGVGPVLTNAGGVYTLNGINAGLQTITATFPGFVNYSSPVNVVGNTTTTFNFCMNPIPGVLSGVVTNCSNGNPVVGVKVSFGTLYTYTVAGGAYTLNVYPGGTQNVVATKEGFDQFTQNGVIVTPPATTTLSFCVNEATPPPSSPFTAVLNAGQTAVNLNWGLPVNDMVLIYDDGIQDNFAIWATGGGDNMNAMKFTPISYPVTVKSFYINIGTAANYPTGNAFSPVQITIFNEVGGLPGTEYPGVSNTITPTVYGWTKADFTIPLTITSGNFFIVMIQLGNALASPGIAVDTTVQQLRSYSKFGATQWIPGPGNFMMRAVVNGSGGPLLMGDQSGIPITASAVPGLIYQYTPATVTGFEGSPKGYSDMGYGPDNLLGYQVWRLLQTQEGTPALWTSVGTPTSTNITDNSWPSLPCGPYRWAAKAQYTFNRWSNAAFSNAVGKCWTCSVTINVDMSCDSTSAAGAVVKFQSLDVVDTVYTYIMTATGTHTFTPFWKGNYTLTVTKYGYTTYTQTPISILGDMTINVTVLQIKSPPTGLRVPDSTLLATWYPPVFQSVLLNEPFSSGSFSTNQWVADGGSNWAINSFDGNPGYCAEYYYYPVKTSYSESLTSKTIVGVFSPELTLKYDIHLDNYSTATLEQLAVEVWNGSVWTSVNNYTNSSGSIAYKTETVDISAYANLSFKVRFRAYGDDSFNINWWDIDNVSIIAHTALVNPNPCVIGYNFYLNNIQAGFTPDTFYNIPPSYVVYGTAYHACVLAVYGSGYSTQSCYDFTSHFLCPPNTLVGVPIECNAYLSWEKPDCGGCTLAQYQYDVGPPYGNALSINPGFAIQNGNLFPVTPPTTAGIIKSFDIWFSQFSSWTTQSCIMYIYNSAYVLIGQSVPFMNGPAATWPSGTWINIPMPDVAYTGPFYAMVDYTTSTVPKNGMGLDVVTPQAGYPQGLAYGYYQGAFSPATTLYGLPAPETFAIRANVCVNGKKDGPITVIDPAKLAAENMNVTPIPGAVANCGANIDVPVSQLNPPPVPDAPTAITLLGYRVFRNNIKIADIPDKDITEYYDYNLDPGTYAYKVDAWYNVAPIVPNFDNSQPAGPVNVSAACGYPLPFFEPWDGGSFDYHQWTFAPTQGNWSFNTAFGNPTPCADFSWNPIVTDYELSLVSPTIDATPWTCADIFCDFDVKLINQNATGEEKLSIDVLKNGNWVNKAEITNTGTIDWTMHHVDISTIKGKGFKVRFRANGVNSGDILHWYVDNIHIYGVCHPAETLAGHQNEFTTTLTWVAPTCGGGGPEPQWIRWDDGANSDAIGTGGAVDFWIAARWDASQIVTLDGGSITKIQFWPASTGVATYSAMIWEGPDPQTPVVNQPIASVVNDQWNIVDLATPHPIDIAQELWIGVDVNASSGWPAGCDAGPQVEGYGNMIYWTGAWATLSSLNPSLTFNWNLAAYVEPSKKEAGARSTPIQIQPPVNNVKGQMLSITGKTNTSSNALSNTGSGLILPKGPMGSTVMGYNVWRTPDNLTTPFSKINPTLVNGLTYQDVHPGTTEPNTTWKYYVTAVFHDTLNIDPNSILCEPPSDTITIMFPAVGINDLTNSSISMYPNPANDVLNIVSTNDVKTVEVLNYIGQTVYTNMNVNLKNVKLNVAGFKAGVYFVKVTTTSGIKTTKITVTH